MNESTKSDLNPALPSFAQGFECPPTNQRVEGWIPSQGYVSQLQVQSPATVRARVQLIHVFSHVDVSLFLSPFLPLSLWKKKSTFNGKSSGKD